MVLPTLLLLPPFLRTSLLLGATCSYCPFFRDCVGPFLALGLLGPFWMRLFHLVHGRLTLCLLLQHQWHRYDILSTYWFDALRFDIRSCVSFRVL
jgi:hypothetical protein